MGGVKCSFERIRTSQAPKRDRLQIQLIQMASKVLLN